MGRGHFFHHHRSADHLKPLTVYCAVSTGPTQLKADASRERESSMKKCCRGSTGASGHCGCKTGGLRPRSEWRRESARALGCVGGGGRAALGVQPRAAAAPAPAPRRVAHQAQGAALDDMRCHTICRCKRCAHAQLSLASVCTLVSAAFPDTHSTRQKSCCSSFCLAVHGLGPIKAPGE